MRTLHRGGVLVFLLELSVCQRLWPIGSSPTGCGALQAIKQLAAWIHYNLGVLGCGQHVRKVWKTSQQSALAYQQSVCRLWAVHPWFIPVKPISVWRRVLFPSIVRQVNRHVS
jgi:hypothetical protein